MLVDWRCSACGYVVTAPSNELPKICPKCGEKENFERRECFNEENAHHDLNSDISISKPNYSAEDVFKMDRDGAMKALMDARNIALENEKYLEEISAWSKKIETENDKAEELLKRVSKKAKIQSSIVLAVCILPGCLMISILGIIIGFIIGFIISNSIEKRDLRQHFDENKAAYNAYKAEHVEPFQEKINKLKVLRKDLQRSGRIEWAIDLVGKDLFNSTYIDGLYDLIKSGRADNLKEAINKFYDLQHQARMEEMQNAIKNASELTAVESAKQTKLAQNIERNTHEAATAAKISAAANYATYRNVRDINKKI